MGPDLEKSKATTGLFNNNNNNNNSNNKEGVKNCEVKDCSNNEDVEVNIIDCSKKSAFGSLQEDDIIINDDDVTESMSSFGDTLSDNENNGSSSLGEIEVESQLCFGGDVPLYSPSSFDGYGGGPLQMRKKKLTDHWRRFIRPLMWRCKWIELQIKEFQSQALKYDRELAEHLQKEQFGLDSIAAEGFDTKSLPFSSCIKRRKVMKRKKRKRVEETTDITSYMLQHNLFSYYENRKSTAHGTSMIDDSDNLGKAVGGNDGFGFQDGWPSLESRGEDSIEENILWKIEVLQLQARKLKARIEKVVSENPGKFSDVNTFSTPASGDALTSSDHNPASTPEDGGSMRVRSLYTLSQHKPDFNMVDLIPDTVVSSHGEVNTLPDMIESTGQPLVGESGNNTGKGILIHNQAAKEEMQKFQNIGTQQTEKGPGQMEKQVVQVSLTDKPAETFVPRVNFGGKTLPKSRSNVTNNKRKRGRRKSGRGGWNRKS